MDPKPSNDGVLLAQASTGAGGAVLRLPGSESVPRIDDRLVRPETRAEVVRGRQLLAMPSNPPHGDRHFKLDYVIGAHVKEGYVGSTDLLTRSSETSDFATDTCIRRDGIDPKTGTRYLEELAFEVVNEQTLRDITDRAEDLTARGVRRVIGVFVKEGEVREWSPKGNPWRKLDPDAMFSDATLARSFRVRELLDAAEADNAVARALLAKKNPVVIKAQEERRAEGEAKGRAEGEAKGRAEGEAKGRAEGEAKGRAEGEAKGRAEGLRVAVRSLCKVLAIPLNAERDAMLERMSAADLDGLRERIERDRRWD